MCARTVGFLDASRTRGAVAIRPTPVDRWVMREIQTLTCTNAHQRNTRKTEPSTPRLLALFGASWGPYSERSRKGWRPSYQATALVCWNWGRASAWPTGHHSFPFPQIAPRVQPHFLTLLPFGPSDATGGQWSSWAAVSDMTRQAIHLYRAAAMWASSARF